MRNSNVFTFAFVFCVLLMWASAGMIVPAHALTNEDATPTKNEIAPDEHSPIEENPDYQEPDDHDEDSDSEDDDSDDDSDDELELSEDVSVREKINRTLKVSRKKYKRSLQFVKKNRSKITLALAAFAFRREIWKAFVHIITKEAVDPKTGKLRISLTSLLKLFLFVDFLRRLQSGQNASQPSFQALATLGGSNPVFGTLFSKFLRVPMFNPAYIPPISQHYTFERVNERYVKDGMALHKAINARHDGFRWPTSETVITQSMIAANALDPMPSSNETVIVLDWTQLDTSVTTLNSLRDQVSFLLSQYRRAAMKKQSLGPRNNTNEVASADEVIPSETGSSLPILEVVVLLESPGGSAADYGLAAQQLLRLRNEDGVILSVCVDKVAASGGYMLACTASPGQLFAAPFALVGSIGVIGQILNVQDLLEGWGVKPLVFRGGKDKAPLGLIGEVTQSGKEKTQSFVDATHQAFRHHVLEARPILKNFIHKVGSGDVYLGNDAIKFGLVDKITTSDEYVAERIEAGARVLRLIKNRRPRFVFGPNLDVGDSFNVKVQNMMSKVWTPACRVLGLGANLITPSAPMLRQ